MRCITFIISSLIFMGLSYPNDLLGKQLSKDKPTVKVFRLNDKKEVPRKELNSDNGLFFCCEGGSGDDLGRIEVSSKSESSIKIELQNNETNEIILSGNVYLSSYGKNKVTFNVFPWVQICDYGDPGVTVSIFSNDELILKFKYNSSPCD